MKELRQWVTLDRALITAVILVSGHPIVLQTFPEVVLLTILVILFIVSVARSIRPTVSDAITVSCFVLIALAHLLAFPPEILTAVVGFLVRLGIALLVVRSTSHFNTDYVAIFYLLAGLGIAFYGLDLLITLLDGSAHEMFGGLSLASGDILHIGIHNFHRMEEIPRNSGLFWEPGAFAGYLLLALVLLAAHRDLYTNRQYRRRLLVLTVALLTTQSTTGYVLLPLVLALHAPAPPQKFSKELKALVGLGLLIVTVAIAFQIGRELPFVAEKIEEQLEISLMEEPGSETTRIGSLLFDVPFIAERPILGWSPHPSTRASLSPFIHEILPTQGNGLSGFIVKFGVAGFLVFAVSAFFGFMRTFSGKVVHSMVAITVVIGALNGEAFLNHPLFLALMFLGRGRTHLLISSAELSRIVPQ